MDLSYDFSITNDDINDADLNDNLNDNIYADLDDELDDLFDLGTNKRQITMPNMENTTYFKKLSIYPLNGYEMHYFVKQLDILELFPVMQISDYELMTPLQLDALYLILKIINCQTVTFCEHMIREFFEKEFQDTFMEHMTYNTFYSDYSAIYTFFDEFCVDVSLFVVRFLKLPYQKIIHNKDSNSDKTVSVDEQAGNNIGIDRTIGEIILIMYRKLRKFCLSTLNSEYYAVVMNKFEIEIDSNFFRTYIEFFKNITRNMVLYTQAEGSRLLAYLFMLVSDFSNALHNSTTENSDIAIGQLITLIGTTINIETIAEAKIDAVEIFIDIMKKNLSPYKLYHKDPVKISYYHNFLYSSAKKQSNSIHAFWRHQGYDDFTDININDVDDTDVDNTFRNNYRNMGYSIQADTYFMLKLFAMSKLVQDESQLANAIVHIMEVSRNEPGIFNKYDDIDLETSYMMIAMSNDISDSYDIFLAEISERQDLPLSYPLEFVMRIISRLLNIPIHLYETNMECIVIDNTIGLPNKPVVIGRRDSMKYYLLKPIDDHDSGNVGDNNVGNDNVRNDNVRNDNVRNDNVGNDNNNDLQTTSKPNSLTSILDGPASILNNTHSISNNSLTLLDRPRKKRFRYKGKRVFEI